MNNNLFNFVNDSEIKCENKTLGIKNYNNYKNYTAFNFLPNLHIVNLSIFILIIFSLLYLSSMKLRI